MSKITIDKSKVIIDGHASDLETCNTLTNLCDELSNSDKFRTVRYENGYGEFESVNENVEKKFAADPPPSELRILSNDGSETLLRGPYFGEEYLSITTDGISWTNSGIEYTYTYSGIKDFVGLSNMPNTGVAKYPCGSSVRLNEYTLPISLYIVENIVLPDSYSTLTALFSDIATVIREKTGDTASIVADNFPDVIRERLQVKPPREACLTFSSPSSFTIKTYNATKNWDGTLEYSTNKRSWTEWNGVDEISAVSGADGYVLYFSGTGNTKITGSNSTSLRWVITGTDVKCIGDIETLLDYETVESGGHPTMDTSCYQYMFYGCTSLIQAPSIPATTLASSCYSSMFRGCTSLTQAPALPATALASYCYNMMFRDCTSLTKAPALPATTLATGCYSNLFYGCTSLTTAPALPVTTLANSCYYQMFYGCTSLTTAPALPATTLTDACYYGMFVDCTSLTTAPSLPATTLGTRCYYEMFMRCTNLIAVPSLPAKTLASSCYDSMFYRCTKIKVSSSNTGEYTVAYRIPKTGTGTTASTALAGMFNYTGGTFTGTPSINTTYYLSNTNTVVG